MRYSKDVFYLNIIAYTVTGLYALMCILPFIMIVSGSLSEEARIIREGFGFLPKNLNLDAYKYLLKSPQTFIDGYKVTIMVTAAGTILSLLLISMTAYVMFRKDFPYRNQIAFFFYFTTLFNGGMMAHYIMMVRYLHVKNTILALLIPGMLNVFYLLVMRNFMQSSIPESLIEAAKIDGAGDFYIFARVVMPLMKPALASIGLFIALHYWNDWSAAMLYINKRTLKPLQYILYDMLQSSQSSQVASESGISARAPNETFKLAMTVVATGPIVLAYPMVQKYFVKGITIGAVKG